MGVIPRNKGLTRGARAGILLNVVLICALGTALAVGAVVVVRQLSYRTNLRFDLTRDARYSLSDEERTLLRSLEAPVECLFAYGYDDDLMNRAPDGAGSARYDLLDQYYYPILRDAALRIQAVFEEWAKASPQIRFRVLDERRAPAELAEVAKGLGRNPVDLLNRVVLTQARRRREIPLRRMMSDMQWGYFQPMGAVLEPALHGGWHIHGEMVSGLRAVTAGDTVRIGVPSGHDAVYEPGRPEFQELSALMAGEGYSLEPVDLRRVEKVPDGIKLLLFPGLKLRLDTAELAVLDRYELAGGRFLIVADPRLPEDYRPLLERYGCALEPALVLDLKHRDPARRDASEIDSDALCAGRHPIDSPLKERVRVFAGPSRPLTVAREVAGAVGAERTTLLQAGSDGQLRPVTYDARTGAPTVGEEIRPYGDDRPSLAVALKRPAVFPPPSEPRRETRLVVFGGAGLLSPRELTLATHFGNRDLFLNALGWLSEREASIGLTPRDEFELRMVSLNRVMTPFFWIGVVGLPALATLIGGLVRLSRRS